MFSIGVILVGKVYRGGPQEWPLPSFGMVGTLFRGPNKTLW
jgi:hypothetical protein